MGAFPTLEGDAMGPSSSRTVPTSWRDVRHAWRGAPGECRYRIPCARIALPAWIDVVPVPGLARSGPVRPAMVLVSLVLLSGEMSLEHNAC